ncbi:MAG: CDP-alcohol phosphatidyltransferase family protein [Pseudomonadota bacterium]|nr:MAG: hypothetical protein DIU78_25260 [Pseudomonadota bacterium]
MHVPSWLPNALSVLRIALVPVWLALAFAARSEALAGGDPSPVGPIAVAVAIALSDVIDGTLARRYGLATNLGATLDAVADKIAQITWVSFLSLVGAPAFTALPLWLLGILAARDLTLGIGWVLVRRKHGKVEAEHRWHGKASSVLLFFLIVGALSGLSAPVIGIGAAAVVVLVVPSTLAYLVAGWRQLMHPGT